MSPTAMAWTPTATAWVPQPWCEPQSHGMSSTSKAWTPQPLCELHSHSVSPTATAWTLQPWYEPHSHMAPLHWIWGMLSGQYPHPLLCRGRETRAFLASQRFLQQWMKMLAENCCESSAWWVVKYQSVLIREQPALPTKPAPRVWVVPCWHDLECTIDRQMGEKNRLLSLSHTRDSYLEYLYFLQSS